MPPIEPPGRRIGLNDPDLPTMRHMLERLGALVDSANMLLAAVGSADRISLRVVLYPSSAEALTDRQGPSVRVKVRRVAVDHSKED